MTRLMDLYYRLPSPVRSLAVTVRGYYLRSWRYGTITEKIAAEALAKDFWNEEQWSKWQSEQLAKLLHRAATQVPYYREMWAKRRANGDNSSWMELSNWPVLEKEPLRHDPRAFIADDCNIKKMYCTTTSGTTGKSLEIWSTRETLTQYYGVAEARGRLWYGVSRHKRWAMQGGVAIIPPRTSKPPFWVWNRSLNQLYLSAYHLTRDRIPMFLDVLSEYKIEWLYGYPSYLYIMANEMLRTAKKTVKLKVVITSAEPLFDYQREVIEKAFGCPVRETWGMSEMCASAGECEHGRMHLWPEVGITEIMSDGIVAPENISGEMICTGLVNHEMPLIRYRIGDQATLAPNEKCECGRTLPILKSIDGRTFDMIYLPNGRITNRFEPIFSREFPLIEGQVIQESVHKLRLLYVPTSEFTEEHAVKLLARAKSFVGCDEVDITLEACESIPRTPSGKFKTVVCNLPADQKAAIQRGDFDVILQNHSSKS